MCVLFNTCTSGTGATGIVFKFYAKKQRPENVQYHNILLYSGGTGTTVVPVCFSCISSLLKVCLTSFFSRPDDFDLVSGQLDYKLDRLAPGGNSSQTVVVRPRKFGYFNFTAAEVRN
jgi:hypothetical protein